MDTSNTFLIIAILVPILFVIGVIYNAIKDQSKLEKTTLKEVLKERERRQALPKDHPDFLYVKPYDEDEIEELQSNTKTSKTTNTAQKAKFNEDRVDTVNKVDVKHTSTQPQSTLLDRVDSTPLSALPKKQEQQLHAARYFASHK